MNIIAGEISALKSTWRDRLPPLHWFARNYPRRMAHTVVGLLMATFLAVNAQGLPQPEDLFISGMLCLAILMLVVLIKQQTAVHELAYRDPLTGLANRRSLDQCYIAAKQKFLDRGRPLALISLDLDHFKAINDNWGHQSGDVVLRMLANRCESLVRPGDVVARMGGEEFVILMPGATMEVGMATAERIRVSLAALRCAPVCADGSERAADGELIPLTASFGVAEAKQDCARTFDELSKAADARLYRAKRAGRNRVIGR